MTEFLLFVLIVVVLSLLNKLSVKMNRIQGSINELDKKLQNYKEADTVIPESGTDFPPLKPRPSPPVHTPEIQQEEVTRAPWQTWDTDAEKAGVPVSFTAPSVQPAAAPSPYIQKQSWWQRFKERNPDLERFIGENLINKIGILILVLGISYFVKFAIDKEWINEPARVGIGILAGALVLLVAFRLRTNYKAFSSVLVAGAISIFYFTIAVAFHDYHLFGQTAAFIIMVGITAFSTFISVTYDRMELAALSLIGGFAVPFMVSTGSGNYVVLLSYIAILNIGILLIAYYKRWPLINLQDYVFTISLYGAWLYQIIGDEDAPYIGALAFGFGYYLIFIVMNIIYSIRYKVAYTSLQLLILVSSSFFFYAAGMVILEYYNKELQGLFTLLLGVFNFCFSWILYKQLKADNKVVYILIGLTLTFVTLAIPTQFEGNYITLFWAAESVLLIWLAQKSGIYNFRLGAIAVQLLMLISLVMDWTKIYSTDDLVIIGNPGFLTGLFCIAAMLAANRLLRADSEARDLLGFRFDPMLYSRFLGALTILVIYFAGFLEIGYQSGAYLESGQGPGAMLVVYHLAFSIIFVILHSKINGSKEHTFCTVLCILNIVLFLLVFSSQAFSENHMYVEGKISSQPAYWLHILSSVLVIFTAVLLYRINRVRMIELFRSSGVLPWIAVLCLVYFTSQELMLHGVVHGTQPVTPAEAALALRDIPVADRQYTDVSYYIAYDKIGEVKNQIIKTGFPVLWGVLAFLLLIIGIRRQLKMLRISALVLLGLTIVKLFVYDIRNVSETGKIVAFILLGILILIISFVYQKLKLLVVADQPPKEDETN